MEHKSDLNLLAAFDLVAQHQGFGRAAAASGHPKATLSRQVRALEDALALRLIDRHGRAFALTDEGRMLHQRTHDLLAEVGAAMTDLVHDRGVPRGRLRVSCPLVFGHRFMGRIAAGFFHAFPQIGLEVTVSDRQVDLVEEGYDVVIRVNPPPDSRLVGRCIMRDHSHVIASPDLAPPSGGTGPVPAIMRSFTRENLAVETLRGTARTALTLAPALTLPSLLMQRDAVLAGGLAAVLPYWLVAEDIKAGRLADWGQVPQAVAEVWVLHAGRRLTSLKVKALVDFLVTGANGALPQRVPKAAGSADVATPS